MDQILKYPRTRHIEGSRRQTGDEDLDSVPFQQIAGRHLVVEEKLDGANCGIGFTSRGELQLQSRGHYLTGGPRERHFALLKRWAVAHQFALFRRLSDRYLMYAEWLYAKHTIYYDALPHYCLEFDVFDRESSEFLDTPRRRELLNGLPVASVPVLFGGTMEQVVELTTLVGQSAFIQDGHRSRLRQAAQRLGLDLDRVLRETDPGSQMEGLYIKVEEDGVVRERYKFVRHDFLSVVAASDSHWLNRPIIPNRLRSDADIFAPSTDRT
jgi:hypothetical protein